MCANKTCTSVLTVSAPTFGARTWPVFAMAMFAIVEAFQEALAMRRDAQRSYFFNDE